MHAPQTIAAGDIVSGLEPNELVEVRRVAPFGQKTLVQGVTLQTKHEIKRPLSAPELAQLVKVRSQAHSFDGDPQVFLLGAEAKDRDGLVEYLPEHELTDHAPLWKLAQALFEVLPPDIEDWKLISALLGERESLRTQAKRTRLL